MLTNKLTGAGAADKTYIEDVFSTYLYTGAAQGQVVTTGMDLSTNAGMLWIKNRSNAYDNAVYDTLRGRLNHLITNSTSAQTNWGEGLSFTSSGFSFASVDQIVNQTSHNYVAWTFRKAPKFFDVVTYTGDGTNPRNINHSLGVVPGMVIIKCTSSSTEGGNGAANWRVRHNANGSTVGNSRSGVLNSTSALIGPYDTTDTSTTFRASGSQFSSDVQGNMTGYTYVAYLFAHDTTTDGLIQCGSFGGGTGSEQINLGWEPQYILYKATNTADQWYVYDNMRGLSLTSNSVLYPNLSMAEGTGVTGTVTPTATGFTKESGMGSNTYIYMAIRRGPMRTPTDGTKVFSALARSGTGVAATITNPSGFALDTLISVGRTGAYNKKGFFDRLRGWSAVSSANGTPVLTSTTTDNESNNTSYSSVALDNSTGFGVGTDAYRWVNGVDSAEKYVYYMLKRAPSFFDVVCYTGTVQSPTTVYHNLKIAPELIIIKNRYYSDAYSDWFVYAAPLGANKLLYLNKTNAAVTDNTAWFNTIPTATQFKVDGYTSLIHEKAVAYLFASCPGVSKVGSYTGNGSSQTINCGFTNGARFVMIKRTDSTGDWYVWDTARGIVASTEPHVSLNTSAAEVTTDDTIDPASSGFVVNQVAATNLNVSGGSYIYLAIA